MMKSLVLGLCVAFLATGAFAQGAADNTLTPAERGGGWTLLFDGK